MPPRQSTRSLRKLQVSAKHREYRRVVAPHKERHRNCVQAWAEFSVGNLIELLNAVRNRILDFTLAVWKEAPTAGNEPNRASPGIADARVTQIFNTTVYGGAAQLVGNAHHSTVPMNVSKNDFESLATALREHAVGDQEIASLQHAIRD